jgi:hypothetical protein
MMVDSGQQISNGYVDFAAVYSQMVNTALARPSAAEITAAATRVGDHVQVSGSIRNHSGVILGPTNGATLHLLAYEEAKVGVTSRYVRAAASLGLASNVAPGAWLPFSIDTADLTGVDWNHVRAAVIADYRPGGASGAYDTLQAADLQLGAPTITSVNPVRGATVGGTTVHIEGAGFTPGATVSFGGQAATDVVVSSSTSIQARTPAHPSGAVDVTVANGGLTATLGQAFRYVNVATGIGLEFDADLAADIGVYRPATGEWFILPSAAGFDPAHAQHFTFGQAGDQPLLGDFDGDGKRDVAVYRPATGTWFWLKSGMNNTEYEFKGGGLLAKGDLPAPGDYDGDGRTDPTVYRPQYGTWFVLKSSSNYTEYVAYGWGTVGDALVPGDYDGDGTTDVAVYRATTGEWFILPSSTGFNPSSAVTRIFGQPGDVPVAGDYDGDGKRDIAVYRASTGTWFWLKSSANNAESGSWGWGLNAEGDVPVPGDYDGDGKTDLCVYRPKYGTWFVLRSATGNTTYSVYGWGLDAQRDVPLGPPALVVTPLVLTGPANMVLGSRAMFTATTWLADPVQYRFTMGDGSAMTSSTTAQMATGSYLYVDVGAYTVTAEVWTSGGLVYATRMFVSGIVP